MYSNVGSNIMTQEDKHYPDKVYALYNKGASTYTNQDIQYDADRVHMLDDLWFIAFSSALLWKTEHPGYTDEEEVTVTDKYYKLVLDAFWREVIEYVEALLELRAYDTGFEGKWFAKYLVWYPYHRGMNVVIDKGPHP